MIQILTLIRMSTEGDIFIDASTKHTEMLTERTASQRVNK